MKKTPLRKESAKQRAKNKAYRDAVPLTDALCYFCRQPATSRHHIYSQAQEPHMRIEPLNILPVCLVCHNDCEVNHEALREVLRKRMPERMDFLDVMAKRGGKVGQIKGDVW